MVEARLFGHLTGPDEFEIGPWHRAGFPFTRHCACGKMMKKMKHVVQRIVEPVQVWVDYHCDYCGAKEYWTYDDTWDVDTGQDLPVEKKKRWQRRFACFERREMKVSKLAQIFKEMGSVGLGDCDVYIQREDNANFTKADRSR